jgi:hypothetical protein
MKCNLSRTPCSERVSTMSSQSGTTQAPVSGKEKKLPMLDNFSQVRLHGGSELLLASSAFLVEILANNLLSRTGGGGRDETSSRCETPG